MEQFRDKHLVIITGGTGLAPVRSMLNMLADTAGYARSVHLICGFKNADGIVFHNELESWKQSFSTKWYTGRLAHGYGHCFRTRDSL